MTITVILDNVRSTYNVGAIMRTLDAVGGGAVVCCGITPYPELPNDTRSPVVQSSNTKAIAKTALGAELAIDVSHQPTSLAAIAQLKSGTKVVALEQAPQSIDLFSFRTPSGDIALVVGSEVDGLASETLEACDAVLQIPQYGTKESLNVSVAAGIALYAVHSTR